MHATASVLGRAGQMELLYHPPTYCPKSYSYKKTFTFPQDKGPYDPQVKIPVPPTAHFPLRTVKYTAPIKNTENNFHLEEKYILSWLLMMLQSVLPRYLISESLQE